MTCEHAMIKQSRLQAAWLKAMLQAVAKERNWYKLMVVANGSRTGYMPRPAAVTWHRLMGCAQSFLQEHNLLQAALLAVPRRGGPPQSRSQQRASLRAALQD